MTFQPGDVVQLKSGGPAMTIEWVAEDEITKAETAACTWFEQVGKRQEAESRKFATVLLKKYQSPYASLATRRV